ncbi:hypothetical protein EN751_24500, partial [Mesorhizobium sp. M4A.F.Ca.ET.029.04.2.1]
MTGASFDAVRLATDTGQSGSITAQAGALTHSIGLASVGAVEDDTAASERIYADSSGQARVIRIGSSDGSDDNLAVLDAGTSNNLIAYRFAVPAVSLTVDAGAGDDSFVLHEIDPALAGKVLLSGGAGSDAVVGPPQDTDWHLTGDGSGHVAGVSFVTVENLIGSADNEDTFFVGAAGKLSGVMAGGDAGFDSMVLDGGTFASVKYVATGQTSGTITRDGVVLHYDGLEPIIDNSVVADRVITTSNADDEATLSDNGATLTLSSDSLIPTFESITFNKPSTSLTINLGDDLGIPILSKDTLTINAVNLGSAALFVNGQDGKDEVTISGTLTAGAVNVNAEKISVSSTVNAGSVTLTAAAADDGEITGGAYFATPEAIIDLTGATIIVTGAAQFSATATANVEAETAEVGPLAGVIATILPEARVKFSSTDVTAASLSASSTVTVTLTAKDESDAGSDNDEKKDAAVSVTVLVSDAITEVLAGSVLSVSGAVSLTATSNLTMTTEADGGSGGKGASVAVSEVNATTRANVSGGSTIGANAGNTPDSIALGATLTSNITTIARSTAGGSDQSAGGDNESEERLKDPNKDSNTSDKATTSGGDITFAGAVTVSDYRPTTEAFVQASTLTSGGAITLTAQSTDKVTATADGTNTNSSANGATGIGVAVVLSIADVTTRSYLGGTSSLSASAVSLSATIAAGDSFVAQATSGAGDGSKTQVAGSLAINIVITEASADVAANASIDLNGADLSLTANSTTNVQTDAVPDDASGAAGELGIGGSVALTIVDNSTSASIRNNAAIVAGDAITMTATGAHTAATTAEAGAEGGDVGIGGAVAIDVIDNNTESSIGSGGELDITGNLTASASNHGVSTTLADGDAIGSTAIGAAIALAFVDNRAFSTSNRNLRSNGSISLSAANDGSSKAESIASAAGAEENEDGNTKADDQRDKEVDLANSKSNDGDSVSKSANSSGGSGGGDVSVAAALALNVSSSVAVASINDGRTVIAGEGAGVGELNLQSSNNMDATAEADGTAKTSDSGTAVGVAVAINIATMRNEASIGAGSIITADGVKAEAKMKNVGGDVTHRFGAESTSGASGGDIGVAGSFALSFADTDTLGVIGLDHADQPAGGAATVTLTGGNVLLTAINTTETTTTATSSGAGSGSGSVGVGASIALGIGLNSTFAGVEDGETVSGTTGNFTVTATSNDTLTTTAKAGAQGATGIGGAIAVAYVDNDTDAHIGTGGGAAITLTGNLAAQASHTGTVHTLADGEAAGSSVGVGASIALNIGEVTNDAFLGRNFQNVGTVTITATSTLDTKAESKASSKGQSTKKSDGTTDSANSDQETTNQTEMAKNQSGGTKTPTQSGSSSLGQADGNSNAQTGKGTQGGNGSGGTNVAATIAVNFLDADNQAQIAGNVTISGTGAMKVEAISTTDARALATATSTNTSSNTGVAAAVGLNIVLLDNNAMIGAGADLTAGSIEVRAATANGQKNTFQARALSGAVSKNTAIGGSVGINYLDVNTLASVGDNVDLDANTGNIEIGAVSLNEMQNLAGGAALSTGSGGGGVGIAVTVNIVNDLSTKAETGINLDAAVQGAINVTSHAELLTVTENLPVIGSLAVTSFADGISG